MKYAFTIKIAKCNLIFVIPKGVQTVCFEILIIRKCELLFIYQTRIFEHTEEAFTHFCAKLETPFHWDKSGSTSGKRTDEGTNLLLVYTKSYINCPIYLYSLCTGYFGKLWFTVKTKMRHLISVKLTPSTKLKAISTMLFENSTNIFERWILRPLRLFWWGITERCRIDLYRCFLPGRASSNNL